MLVACSQQAKPIEPELLPPNSNLTNPSLDSEESLFTDVDVDQAVLELADKDLSLQITEIDLGEGEEIDESEEVSKEIPLSAQATLPNAVGWIAYVQRTSSATTPWKIYVQSQISGKKILVYKGKRAVDSVAVNKIGDQFVFSMRQTQNTSSDFEVYRYIKSTKKLKQLVSNEANDTHVSISANGNTIVWEGQAGSKRVVKIRDYNGNSFNQQVLTSGANQIQPSVSANGRFVAFIRKVSNNDFRVMLHNRNNLTNKKLSSGSVVKLNPSPSNDGQKVSWLHKSTPLRVKVRNLSTNKNITVIKSQSALNHPHLTADGKSLAFSKRDSSGNFEVFTKNLGTKKVAKATNLSTSADNISPFWQLYNGQVGVWGQSLWGQSLWAP